MIDTWMRPNQANLYPSIAHIIIPWELISGWCGDCRTWEYRVRLKYYENSIRWGNINWHILWRKKCPYFVFPTLFWFLRLQDFQFHALNKSMWKISKKILPWLLFMWFYVNKCEKNVFKEGRTKMQFVFFSDSHIISVHVEDDSTTLWISSEA